MQYAILYIIAAVRVWRHESAYKSSYIFVNVLLLCKLQTYRCGDGCNHFQHRCCFACAANPQSPLSPVERRVETQVLRLFSYVQATNANWDSGTTAMLVLQDESDLLVIYCWRTAPDSCTSITLALISTRTFAYLRKTFSVKMEIRRKRISKQ